MEETPPYKNRRGNTGRPAEEKRMKEFEGKTAVITGGARGIGRAVADAFRREGAAVHIIDREPGDNGWSLDPDA